MRSVFGCFLSECSVYECPKPGPERLGGAKGCVCVLWVRNEDVRESSEPRMQHEKKVDW